MAEKKKGWFSRLFGGKKEENVPPKETPIQEQSPIETVEPPIADEKLTSVQEESSPLSTVEEIVKEVAHDIADEFKDSVKPHEKHHSPKELPAQHQFLEEIATEAKEAVEEAATENSIPEDDHQPQSEITKEESVVTESAVESPSAKTSSTESFSENSPSQEQDEPKEETNEKETPNAAGIAIEASEEKLDHSVDEKQNEEVVVEEYVEVTQEKPKQKKGFFARLTSRLSKTRNNITEGLADLFLGKKEINEEILEELETRLLMADVGINVTDQLLTSIRDSVSRKSLSNVDELFAALKVEMKAILEPVSKPLVIDEEHTPYVILMIGVNGVGKTTTIGKLAKKFQAEGRSVMLAAGDTFRAAAVEQLQVWGERNKIPVISQKEGADPASVIFDAMESAKARKIDILIADTAGRLHTDSGLMQELAKINRVVKRHDASAPHEVMLVVDASTGQNALNQARQFNETVPITGMTFTKLDGTAKGGILFAIAEELEIPIRFIGVGETIDDLRPFNSNEFVDALISTEENEIEKSEQ